jgi:hypothetical protein
MSPGEEPVHTPLRLTEPRDWVLFLTSNAPRRLVVFVHGFYGGPLRSWQEFPRASKDREWWQESDLLFVGYPSGRDNIAGTAYRVRRELSKFFPELADEFLEIDGVRCRQPGVSSYRELLLVGHSLGGLIVRRALIDSAEEWMEELRSDPSAQRPDILDARAYLFSPASAGFRPAGWLGLMRAGPAWTLAEMQLRRSSAYTDLQPNSDVLVQTRRRTEAALGGPKSSELEVLRARILWANPDDVVIAERYDTDFLDHFVDAQTHRSVCKPGRHYETPWHFVETGKP